MRRTPAIDRGRLLNWRLMAGLIAGAVMLLLIIANAHLVYVAITSQPDCVAHSKTQGQDGVTLRAARPAC